MKTVLFLLALVMPLSTVLAQSNEPSEHKPSCPFDVWLGPQTNRNFLVRRGHLHAIVASSDSGKEDNQWAKIKDKMIIDLRIIEGSKVKLPDTQNGYTTLINGEVASLHSQTVLQTKPEDAFDDNAEPVGVIKKADLQIRPDNMYVMGVVRQKETSKGRYVGRFYSLNARISKGPLKGAIVHLRDDNLDISIEDPYVAIYKIPAHIRVSEGILEYKIVRIYRK